MQYTKDYVYKIATNLDVKSCRIFLLMWSMSDDEGNVATSLGQIHKETGLAKSTVRDAFAGLQKAGLLQIEYEIGLKSYYKLLYPKEITVEEKPKRRRAKSKATTMRVIRVTREDAEILDIPNTEEALVEQVGGFLEVMSSTAVLKSLKDYVVVLDGRDHSENDYMDTYFNALHLVGTAIFCKQAGDKFEGLSEAEATDLLDTLKRKFAIR